MQFQWGRGALTLITLAVGAVVLLVGLGQLPSELGSAVGLLLLGALLAVSAVYSFRVTRWWTAVTAPPLQPGQVAAAHVAPALGLLMGGFLIFAVWLGFKIAFQSR